MAAGALVVAGMVPLASGSALATRATPSSNRHMSINCEYSPLCPDVANSQEVFGNDEYVGHDEPSMLFYSNTPGSGNRMRYQLTLPHDPTPANPTAPGKAYNFELHGSFWFGMALCDTQSYPEQISTCPPDSDSNILDPAVSPNHAGTAFMELQFYPPGWIPWPTWAVAVGASTCSPTRWCAAMNVFSLLEDPVNGTFQNDTCAAKVGLETFQFAFVTRNGVAQAPANPLDSTLATYTPNPGRDLFMESGDHLQVSLHDTANGLEAEIADQTTGQSGSMTASPANGFDQIQYDPTGTSCNGTPYAFHPMYSTSSEQTRVIWAAHSYNTAFSDEIGHFQFCNGAAVPATPFGVDGDGNPIACPDGNTEGSGADQEPTEGAGEDDFCFPAKETLLVRVQGCSETNTGFDGVSYEPVWPDGNSALHPTPIQFTSPVTGANYDQPYDRAAFEADLPRIEFSTCNRVTGTGCTLIPTTDDNQPADFYPFFTNTDVGGTCNWQFGNSIPGDTREFGKNAQYGSLLPLDYLVFGGHGATNIRYNDFRNIVSNPC
ncbi:MAG: hypothetical protein ACJ77A_11300 [Actinomycetota bacterium]